MDQNPAPTQRLGISPQVGKAFVAMLEADLKQNGRDVVERLRTEKPYDYLRIVVSLLPSEVPVGLRIEDLTDDQLAAALGILKPMIARKLQEERSLETAVPDPQGSDDAIFSADASEPIGGAPRETIDATLPLSDRSAT